jgi:hypothetical protein
MSQVVSQLSEGDTCDIVAKCRMSQMSQHGEGLCFASLGLSRAYEERRNGLDIFTRCHPRPAAARERAAKMTDANGYSEDNVEMAQDILKTILGALIPKLREVHEQKYLPPGAVSAALAAVELYIQNGLNLVPKMNAVDVLNHSTWFAELMQAGGTADLRDPAAICTAAGQWAYAFNDEAGSEVIEKIREKRFQDLLACRQDEN